MTTDELLREVEQACEKAPANYTTESLDLLDKARTWLPELCKIIREQQAQNEGHSSDGFHSAKVIHDLQKQLAEQREQLEIERLRVVACGMAAIDPKQCDDMHKDLWTASCGDVQNLRSRYDALKQQIKEQQEDTRNLLATFTDFCEPLSLRDGTWLCTTHQTGQLTDQDGCAIGRMRAKYPEVKG